MSTKAELQAALLRLVAHEDEPCDLDHHGSCQEHSSGAPCAVAHARQLLGMANSLDPANQVEPCEEHLIWDMEATCISCGFVFIPSGYQIHERLTGEMALNLEVFAVVHQAIHGASKQCLFGLDECLTEGACAGQAQQVITDLINFTTKGTTTP